MARITKGATVCKSGRPDDGDLALINAQALEPLSREEVFAFRVTMCDNACDRDFERIADSALGEMAPLFVGKTVVKDHEHRSDNQVARIYECHVEEGEGGYRSLSAGCYMLDTPANAELIAEVKGGIRREVSVCFGLTHAVCSICGADNCERMCSHVPGKLDKKTGKVCEMELSGVTDAYELSFVAVPAQRAAGVTRKDYGGAEADLEDGEPPAPVDEGAIDEQATRLRASRAWARGKSHDAA